MRSSLTISLAIFAAAVAAGHANASINTASSAKSLAAKNTTDAILRSPDGVRWMGSNLKVLSALKRDDKTLRIDVGLLMAVCEDAGPKTDNRKFSECYSNCYTNCHYGHFR
jgi:hypothetical protein